jgi:hypothetical protein
MFHAWALLRSWLSTRATLSFDVMGEAPVFDIPMLESFSMSLILVLV